MTADKKLLLERDINLCKEAINCLKDLHDGKMTDHFVELLLKYSSEFSKLEQDQM